MTLQNPANPIARRSKAASLDATDATADAAMCSTLVEGGERHG